MPKQFYSAGEAAQALGISLDTLRRWDRDGRIKTSRDGGNRRIVPARGDRPAARRRRRRHSARATGFAGRVTEVKVEGLLAQVELVVDRAGARGRDRHRATRSRSSACEPGDARDRGRQGDLGDGASSVRSRGCARLVAGLLVVGRRRPGAATGAARHGLRRGLADGRLPEDRRPARGSRSPARTRSPRRSARARRPTSSPPRTRAPAALYARRPRLEAGRVHAQRARPDRPEVEPGRIHTVFDLRAPGSSS